MSFAYFDHDAAIRQYPMPDGKMTPNVAKDSETIEKNTFFIMEMMNKRGIQKVQLLHASTTGAPLLFTGK